VTQRGIIVEAVVNSGTHVNRANLTLSFDGGAAPLGYKDTKKTNKLGFAK
jgi:hypothetical protein